MTELQADGSQPEDAAQPEIDERDEVDNARSAPPPEPPAPKGPSIADAFRSGS